MESERITIECACGAKLKVSAESAGRRGKCPKCGELFTVPDAAPLELAPLDLNRPYEDPDSGSDAEETTPARTAARAAPKPASPREAPLAAGHCSRCGKAMPAAGVLCVHCGFNAATGALTHAKHETDAAAEKGLRKRVKGAGTFFLGCMLSLGGALVGAGTWFGIAVVTNYELGWIAWGLGVLAGAGMALGYREETVQGGVVAAGIAVVGILAAKIAVFLYVNYSEVVQSGSSTPLASEAASFFFRNYFGGLDLLFVLFAVGSAYRLGRGNDWEWKEPPGGLG